MRTQSEWYLLPGPATFLGSIEDAIRECTSVVAISDPCYDTSWISPLRSRLDGVYTWIEVAREADLFLQRISNRPDKLPFAHCREIVASGISQNLYFINNPPPPEIPKWIALLSEFAESQKQCDPFDRNVFLLRSEGNVAFPNHLLITSRNMGDYIREDDLFFFASSLLDRSSVKSLVDEVRVHVCAELSIWDFDLCNYLFDLNIQDLLHPAAQLRSYVRDHLGLEDKDAPAYFAIARSSSRKSSSHSALLAIDGNDDELQRRVWRGEVQVLFPMIEDQRFRLIKELETHYPAPLNYFNDEEETIELGPLFRAIKREGRCPPVFIP